jgi:hypothetical protein
MMNIGLHHRSVDPQLAAVCQSAPKFDPPYCLT